MSEYRRWRIEGGDVFLTLVTYGRRPILTSALGRRRLRTAIESTRQSLPFDLFASVVLPDHWHLVMRLPSGDADYSKRVQRIKRQFTTAWIDAGGLEAPTTESQRANGERGVWQPRFWEHTIRDEEDLKRCVDYLHWNPRKHGIVRRVRDWPWSSFHRFVAEGEYALDWGGTAPLAMQGERSWGEP